jgi:hypothetical protein
MGSEVMVPVAGEKRQLQTGHLALVGISYNFALKLDEPCGDLYSNFHRRPSSVFQSPCVNSFFAWITT